MFRDLRHEIVYFLLSHYGAYGIGGIRNEHDARILRNSGQEAVQVMRPVLLVGHFHVRGAKQLGHDRVHGKGVFGGHHLRTGIQQGMADQFNHFAAARAHYRLAELHAAELRNSGTQAESRSVRINVHAGSRTGNRLHRLRGRPQRIFIRRQFHNNMGIQAQFPGRLLNRLARLISHQLQHMLICETLNTHSGGMLPPFPVSGNTDFHPAGPWEDDSRLENLRWRKSGNLFRNFSILPATPFYRRKAAVHFLRQISACFS